MVLALPSLDGYLRTGLDNLIESASPASMILLRARALHRCCPGGLAEPESAGRWERERLAVRRRTGEGFGPGPLPCCRDLGVLEPAHGLWYALLIAVVLLAVPGLTGGPSLPQAAGQEAGG